LTEQVIGNVVGNAVVHTPPESEVMLDAIAGPDSIKLRVTDNGPGIAAEELPHIFEKFVKGGDTRALHFGGTQGTGLGLAIAKGIMEAHDGAIQVESPVEKGRGARFVLTFPREGLAG
jgi:two-component system sensor histidine kinase KdpD